MTGKIGVALRYLPVLFRGRPLLGEERYRPFFIIGSGRCGTTLLRATLDTDPSVHIPPETYALGHIIREYPLYSRLPWDPLLRLILTRFEYNTHWPTFGIALRELYYELEKEPRERLNLALVLNRFYEFHARAVKPTATRWGDKTPLYTFYIPELLSVFPDARFIHMVRDGRDVVQSYRRLDRYSIREAAERWTRSVRLSRELGRQRPGQFLEVRYEELVSRPEESIREVCAFLDLDFGPHMLRHHESDRELGDVERLEHHAAVKDPISGKAVGKWRDFFTEEEAREVEEALGPTLAWAGYE